MSQTDPEGTTTWTFDAAGQEKSTSYNGRLLASVDRNRQNRRVVITDHTGADGLTVEHELGFNRRGQLISRTRGGQGLLMGRASKHGVAVALVSDGGEILRPPPPPPGADKNAKPARKRFWRR